MKITNVGSVIAIREFYLLGGGVVTVVIGKPEKFPNADEYFCPYQITGIKRSNIRYAGGVDAVQALVLALKMVGADLYSSDEAQSGALTWNGSVEKGDLGFPQP
jgi:hypothetical protein